MADDNLARRAAEEAQSLLSEFANPHSAAADSPEAVRAVVDASHNVKAIREAIDRQGTPDQPRPPRSEAFEEVLRSVDAPAARMVPAGETPGQARRRAYRDMREAMDAQQHEAERQERRQRLFNRFRRIVDAEIAPETPGQRRRKRYRAFRYQQQRSERRQRLADRMANRTTGGRAGTMLDALSKGIRNPRDAATQISRFATAAGMKGITPAVAKAAGGPVAAAVAIAETAQRIAMSTQRFATEASSPFMGKAEHGVASGMAESATKAAVYGPLGMLKEMAMLPKHIADWDEALLQSKRGLAQFSGAINNYFAEAERREIVRGVESAQATGGSLSRLGDQWQSLQDELRPLKDTITTHLAAILTVGTAMIRGINIMVQWSPAYIAMKKMADAYEAANRKEAATPFNVIMNEFRKAGATSTRAPKR